MYRGNPPYGYYFAQLPSRKQWQEKQSERRARLLFLCGGSENSCFEMFLNFYEKKEMTFFFTIFLFYKAVGRGHRECEISICCVARVLIFADFSTIRKNTFARKKAIITFLRKNLLHWRNYTYNHRMNKHHKCHILETSLFVSKQNSKDRYRVVP